MVPVKDFMFSEAATGGFLLKKLFLKILQYSRENMCCNTFSKPEG